MHTWQLCIRGFVVAQPRGPACQEGPMGPRPWEVPHARMCRHIHGLNVHTFRGTQRHRHNTHHIYTSPPPPHGQTQTQHTSYIYTHGHTFIPIDTHKQTQTYIHVQPLRHTHLYTTHHLHTPTVDKLYMNTNTLTHERTYIHTIQTQQIGHDRNSTQ